MKLEPSAVHFWSQKTHKNFPSDYRLSKKSCPIFILNYIQMDKTYIGRTVAKELRSIVVKLDVYVLFFFNFSFLIANCIVLSF